MGKVIGGGLPVGAYGGRRDIMQLVAPAGTACLPLYSIYAPLYTLRCRKLIRIQGRWRD